MEEEGIFEGIEGEQYFGYPIPQVQKEVIWSLVMADTTVRNGTVFDALEQKFPDFPAFNGPVRNFFFQKVSRRVIYCKDYLREAITAGTFELGQGGHRFFHLRTTSDVMDFANVHNIYSFLLQHEIPCPLPSNCRNLDQFRTLMKCTMGESLKRVFTVPITTAHLDYCECSEMYRDRLVNSLCFLGIGNLYNLYSVMIHVDTVEKRMISCDGTFSILNDRNMALISIGAICVDSSPRQPSQLKRKFRPLLHLITEGETIAGATVLAKILDDLSQHLLGMSFSVGHFVSDNSAAIRGGVSKVLPYTKQHLCYPHIFRLIDTNTEWSRKIGNDKIKKSRVKTNITMLANCSSFTTFEKLFQMVMKRWTEDLELNIFAETFQEQYGPHSRNHGNWFLGTTAVVVFLPNNNAMESYFHQVKGSSAS